jgi:hypothetical protein
MIALLILAVNGLLPPFASCQQLEVGRHSHSELSDKEARTNFSGASLILQTKDGADDIACNVTLSLAGSVSSFDSPVPADIYTSADFRQVCAAPGYVHVVNTINYCGGLALPGIIGCGDTPGTCIVVVRLEDPLPADKEGMLWAHEYGHTKGLDHREDENAVMNPYLGQTERQVNATECRAFAGRAQSSTRTKSRPKPGIVDFVHRDYVEGVPYDLASSYNREDAEKLIGLLDDQAERPYLTNIVVTLGMIGDPVAVQPLQSFVERGEGYVDSQTLRAKTSALVALGYIVNKHNDETALRYLAQGLNPNNWKERKLKWMLRNNDEQRNISLIKASALGLGISGTPEAAAALNSAQFTIQSVDPSVSVTVNPVIEHALAINKTIQQKGLKRYHLEIER